MKILLLVGLLLVPLQAQAAFSQLNALSWAKDDGTDQTANMQRAVNVAVSINSPLYVPPGIVFDANALTNMETALLEDYTTPGRMRYRTSGLEIISQGGQANEWGSNQQNVEGPLNLMGAFSPTNLWADPRKFGAVETAADNTAAFQAAINTGQDVFMPKGQYTNMGTLNFTNQFQRFRGVGANMSIIVFNPASSNTCIRFGGLSGTKMFHTGFSGIQLKCVSNSVDKVGLELVDVSLSKFFDFQVNPWFSNGSSTNTHGMIVRGRDTTSIRDFTIYANQAVAVMANPGSYITMDQFHWSNYELFSSVGLANFLVYPEDCFIASTTFSPYSSASAATNSFYWVDNALTRRSLGLHFNGLRPEQTLTTNGWQIYIDLGDILEGGTNNILQNFSLENSYLNYDRNGVYLRGVQGVTFKNVMFAMSTGQSQLDVDGTCEAILLDNIFSQQGGEVSIIGLTNRVQYPKYVNGPLPSGGWFTRYGTNVADNTAFMVSPGLALNGFFNINNGNFYMRDTGGAITPIRRETTDWVGIGGATNEGTAFQMNLSTNTGPAEALLDAFKLDGNGRTNIAIQKSGGTVTIGNGTTNAIGHYKLEIGGHQWVLGNLITGPNTNMVAPVTHYGQAVYHLNSDWASGVGTGLLISRGAASGDTFSSINSFDQGGNSPADLKLQSNGGNILAGGNVNATNGFSVSSAVGIDATYTNQIDGIITQRVTVVKGIVTGLTTL